MKSLSISIKTSLMVFGIVSFTLIIYLIIFFITNVANIYKRTEEENKELSSLLAESIRLYMATGADDTKPFIENLTQFEKIKDVRIIPTEIVGGSTAGKYDDYDRAALVKNTAATFYEDYQKSKVLRSISLLRAHESCIDCHGAAKGDVLVVISIQQSLDKIYSEMNSQKIEAVWMGGSYCLNNIITFALFTYL